jgi:phage FluMu protein Com
MAEFEEHRNKRTPGGSVTLPSGTTIQMERVECPDCHRLLAMVGEQIVSGVTALELVCPRCGTKKLVTKEVA